MSLRRTGITRRTELRRTPLALAFAKQRKQRDTGPDAATKVLLWSRAGGRCEICGGPTDSWLGFSRHHRLPRGRGGKNTISNLLLLCGSGTTGCHGSVERLREVAYDAGWLIRTGHDPAEIPAGVFGRGGKVYLDDSGAYAEGSP